MTTHRGLVAGLIGLAVALAANALLGPLALGVIVYHYGTSLTNQGIGLDAVALVVAVPLALAAAALIRAGREAGLVLAFAPATFAAYMAPQYIVGPDYLGLPGNNEMAAPLHLALLVLGLGVSLSAWSALGRRVLPPDSRSGDRWRAIAVAFVAVFTAGARWLPALAAVWSGAPSADYLDNPTAFWLVATLDLALVVPACVVTVFGLLSGAWWGRKSAYAVIGWFALVPLSVAAMAVTMQVRGDALASMATTVVLVAVAVLLTIAAVLLFRPVLASPAPASRASSDAAPPRSVPPIPTVTATADVTPVPQEAVPGP